MIDLFTVPSSDASIHFLAQIFGTVGTILPPDKAPMLLGIMFRYFNAIVLVVGVLLVIYITIIGLLKTAQEGELLGKQWSSIWIPIRVVIGIAALVPSATGYCALQILMMWIVVQGIGAADTIWTTVLKYTSAMGSPTASPTVPSVDTTNNMEVLYQALVCQSAARATYTYKSSTEADSPDGGYYCASNGDHKSETFCTQSTSALLNIGSSTNSQLNGNNRVYSLGPGGHCGELTYCDPDNACKDTSTSEKNINCQVCRGQKDILQATVNVLAPIADQFTSADYEYRVFYSGPRPTDASGVPSWVQDYCNASGIPIDQCCRQGSPPPTVFGGTTNTNLPECSLTKQVGAGDYNNAASDSVTKIYWPYNIKPAVGDTDFITTTTNNYITSLTNIITAATVANETIQDSTLSDAAAIGWIYAGAYYYYLAQKNNGTLNASLPIFTTVGQDPQSDKDNSLYNLRNNFAAADDLLNTMSSQYDTEDAFDVALPSKLKGLKKLSKGMQKSSSSVLDAFESMLTDKDTNPLVSLQSFGRIVLIVAQTLFALILVVLPALTLTGYFDVFVLGTGIDNPVGPSITTLAVIFAPLGALLLGSLFTFGAMLAIYVPLIPYIIFTMGAIGWFILVIEAMIAAPIVAIGIMSPSGQHELLGKAGDSMMFVLGIFLRPSLMIFGMMASMLLSLVIVIMINSAFSGVMGSIYSKPGAGLVEMILFLCAYVGFMLVALNKCFALIHIVPDQTLRWIGGHNVAGAAGGESAAEAGLGGAKGGVAAGAGEAQKAGGTAAGRAQVMGKSAKETEAAYKSAAAKKNAGPTATGGPESGPG